MLISGKVLYDHNGDVMQQVMNVAGSATVEERFSTRYTLDKVDDGNNEVFTVNVESKLCRNTHFPICTLYKISPRSLTELSISYILRYVVNVLKTDDLFR